MSIPNLRMDDKVVLITGGRRGIGRALALAFAEAGADVATCSRTSEEGDLEALADQIRKLGRRVLAIKADASRKVDVENMVKKTVAELGNIDILINNAAISRMAPALDTGEDIWDEIINNNLKGYYLCSLAVGRLMVEQRKGTIINMASISGLISRPHQLAYCVSKAGIIMLTRMLAREFGACNIRVNAIAPASVNTPGFAGLSKDPDFIKNRLPLIPLGRIGEPEDIIGAALFLASEGAGWITGHTLVIDGGWLA